MSERISVLEKLIENLVVAGRRHREALFYSLLFDAGMLPPGTLEIQDVDFLLGEFGHVGQVMRVGAGDGGFLRVGATRSLPVKGRGPA